MQYKTIGLFCVFILFYCCTEKIIELSEADKQEIKSLIIDQHRNDYLYNLWHADQALRKGQRYAVIEAHGYKSKEYKEWAKENIQRNSIIFSKIKFYLHTHGYPINTEIYNEIALNAFPIIIGHHHTYKEQKKLLPYLYNAYMKGQCPEDDIVWLLGEMYESRHNGKRYKVKSKKFTSKQELEELIRVLALTPEDLTNNSK